MSSSNQCVICTNIPIWWWRLNLSSLWYHHNKKEWLSWWLKISSRPHSIIIFGPTSLVKTEKNQNWMWFLFIKRSSPHQLSSYLQQLPQNPHGIKSSKLNQLEFLWSEDCQFIHMIIWLLNDCLVQRVHGKTMIYLGVEQKLVGRKGNLGETSNSVEV